MKKRILSILLALCMVLALMPQMAFAEGSVTYLDADGTLKTSPSATEVTSSDTEWTGTTTNPGWYVVNTNVTIGTEDNPQRVTVSGDVRLILADGCTLTVNGGIQVQDDDDDITNGSANALTIYAQSTDKSTMGKLIAKGAEDDYNAVIGGNEGNGYGGSGGAITINGGYVEATNTYGAGIGGGFGSHGGGSGGTITINGGVVKAESTLGAGIGGGYSGGGTGGDGGKITITGGNTTASGYTGTAIGGGYGTCGGSGGEVTITGGTVTATGNARGNTSAYIIGVEGIGGGRYDITSGTDGTFQTTNNGNAVIFASSIGDQSKRDSWKGIIFEGDEEGKVYGSTADSPVTPNNDFTIPKGKTLKIGNNQALAIGQGMELTKEGTITNNGKIFVDGKLTELTGEETDNLYYPLTLVGATATGDTSDYNSKNYGKAGSEITLSPAPPTGYGFDKWEASPTSVTIGEYNKFTMPDKPVTVTAKFSPDTYNIAYELNGGTINSGNVTEYTYGERVTLPTDVTKVGYTFKGWYEDKNFKDSPVTAISDTEIGEKTFYAKWAANSYYPILQKPTIEAGEGVKVALSADGTVATITVDDSYEIADVMLNGVSLGKVTEVKNLKTGDKLVVTAEKKAAEPTKEEILAALADQQLTARSKLVTMKNGKKAVKITWYNKNGKMMDFDGVEIYRSTKKNSGYGNKPFYATKGSNTKGYYINTKDVKVGTTYYYRVRGYVIIDGQKYYTDYSLKAIRTVK